MDNALFYGDNLKILRDHIKDETVDLVYLDPPFNSNASYNVLFKERSGEESAAQIKAFEDTWHWGVEAERAFEDVISSPIASAKTKDMLSALRKALGDNDMMAYLAMMTPRLVELHRVLKDTGSLYLHCDPTASHYLKTLLDTIFGYKNFRNEIIWKRTTAHGDSKQGSRHFGRIHDLIFRYSKDESYIWNQQYLAYEQEYIDTYYKFVDENGRRYWKDNLTAAKPGGDTRYEWHGKLPPPNRYWAFSKANMERLDAEGRIIYSDTGVPMYKRYLDEMQGRPLQDIWDDIRGLGGLGSKKEERLGYPTQKPLALLERIIQASSNKGDVVLDPFCGCGTAVAAAQKLNRKWIGIDITHLAISLMKGRLKDMFDLNPGKDYEVYGEPEDLESARQLAKDDRDEFQYWAVSLVTGQPRQSTKKGADKGIDGVIFFMDGQRRTTQKAIVQVKSGHVSSPLVRDLKGVLQRDDAAMGLFITLDEPTKDMTSEAASAGFFQSDLMQRKYAKIQIRTIEDLLDGKTFDMPLRPAQFKQAERVKKREGEQGKLLK